MVETCDKDYYDGQELQAFIEEAVAVYNAANQDGAVALESCTMEEGKAVAVFDYADGTALLNFLKEHGRQLPSADESGGNDSIRWTGCRESQ